MGSDYSSNASNPYLTSANKAFLMNHSRGGKSTMTETVNDIVSQIEQIVFWLKLTVYLALGICIVWLIGFIRRNLGLDTHSIELRRIRRILEDHSSKKYSAPTGLRFLVTGKQISCRYVLSHRPPYSPLLLS
jgi:hypothetical protein